MELFLVFVDGIISVTVNPLYNMVNSVEKFSITAAETGRKTVGDSISGTVNDIEDVILATEVNPAYNAHTTPTSTTVCNIEDDKDTTSATKAYLVYELTSPACNTPTTANTESNIVDGEDAASDADSHAYEVVLTPATRNTACNNDYDVDTTPAINSTVYRVSESKDQHNNDDESDYI